MNAKQDIADTLSTIEERIDLIPMSRHERDAALHCVRIGARFTEAVMRVCNQALMIRAFLMILMFCGMTGPGWSSIPPHERTGTIVAGVLGRFHVTEDPLSTVPTIVRALVNTLIGESMGRSMDDTDQVMVLHTLENSRAGVPSRWRNPRSRNLYTLTLIAAYDVPEGPCFEYTVEAVIGGGEDKVHNTACRLSNGGWDVAQHD